MLDKLKEENENLGNTIHIEKSIKEKYFKMWRMSENEKEKLRTSKMFFSGKCLFTEKPSTEVLQLDPSFLEDVETDSILGQGRFGTVLLKKFRSTPVAVKYFDISTSPRMVEKEAFQIQQCCHINLPIIYGMPIAPCSLPITFRPELSRVLSSKEEQLMTGRLRKQFLARLFEYFSTFTL